MNKVLLFETTALATWSAPIGISHVGETVTRGMAELYASMAAIVLVSRRKGSRAVSAR
jgi:hypothetical protein